VKAAYVSLTERQAILKVNTRYRCSHWSMDEFLHCAKELFLEETLPKINCTIYHFKEFIDPNLINLPQCISNTSAAETYNSLSKHLYSFLFYNDSKCLVPCTQTSYNFELNYYSKNSYYDPTRNEYFSEKNIHLIIFFRKLEIEERTEALVYDIGTLLSAAGGNLGLLVGFSCLSVIFAAIDVLGKLFNWIK
jgi:Amiloride-sensitive sodium channel